MSVIKYHINGMHCGSCASRVETAAAKTAGISWSNVNFATKTLYIEGDVDDQLLAKNIESIGYGIAPFEDSAQQSDLSLIAARRNLIVAGVLAAPVSILAMFLPEFPSNQWIQLVLTTLIMVGPGRSFFTISIRLLRSGGTNMDTLIAMGVGSAWIYSVGAILTGSSNLYFESGAVIIALVLAGRYLEERARGSAGDAIRNLLKLRPEKVVVKINDAVQTIAIDSLEAGMVFLCGTGDRVATDGKVIDGSGYIDESLMTGEPHPVAKGTGSDVIGGTINSGNSELWIEATSTGEETLLSRIIATVSEAQADKAAVQRLADKVASVFVPIVLLIAVVTFLIWITIGAEFSVGLVSAIAVLVIACPCALGLATPTAVLVGSGRAAEQGILIKSARGLEQACSLKTLVLDKTGTLTSGKPEVTQIDITSDIDKIEALRIAATLEYGSSHPLAFAILARAEKEGVESRRGEKLEVLAGLGISGQIDGKTWRIGSKKLVESVGLVPPPVNIEGTSLVYLVRELEIVAVFYIEDPVRPEAKSVISQLKQMGVRTVMATGDNTGSATRVAETTGIDEIHAEMSPEGKLELIESFKDAGLVGMVGDGINDAPAMAKSDLGIAIGTGADVAIDTATIVIPKGDLSRVARSLSISHETMKIIKQNLIWAFVYNVLAIPFAAIGLLSPMIAAGAMSLSSICVVANSLRLKRA